MCVFQEFLIQKTRIYGLQYVLFPSATSYTSYTLHVPYLLDLKTTQQIFRQADDVRLPGVTAVESNSQ